MSLHPKRHHREVILAAARQLSPNLPAPDLPPGTTPEEAAAAAGDIPRLPAGFPTAGLSERQQADIALWYRQHQADLHDTARTLLATEPADTLQHLLLNCVLLCRALRLHPAAEHTVATLARALGVDPSDLTERNRALMHATRTAASHRAAPTTITTIRDLAPRFPQLDFRPSATAGRMPTIIAPFADPHTTLGEQWATATAIGTIPGLTARLAEHPTTGANALAITFPTSTYNTPKRTMSTATANALRDYFAAALPTALDTCKRALARHCLSLPQPTTQRLAKLLDTLHSYAQRATPTAAEHTEAAHALYTITSHLHELEPALTPISNRLRSLLY